FDLMLSSDLVRTLIGRDAKIASFSDVSITATTTYNVQTASEATISKPTSRSNADGSFEGKSTGAAAIALSINAFEVTTQALIEKGAQVDAGGTLTVSASAEHPFTLPFRDPSTFKDFFEEKVSKDFASLFANLLDGSLGIQSLALNNFSRTR